MAAKRSLWFLMALGCLCVTVAASLAVGSRPVSPGALFEAVLSGDWHGDGMAMLSLRLPRTLLGLLSGSALGMAGVVLQALTRNPLADPGILGINAGAAFMMVLGGGLFGLTGWNAHIWLSFAGAAVAALIVHGIGFYGPRGGIPVRLTLAGVAVGAMLGGVINAVLLLDPVSFDRMRGWSAGTLAAPNLEAPLAIAPFVSVGLLLALACGRSLNALSLGEDIATAMGVGVLRTRTAGGLAATLLAGAATAGTGPIAFVGLLVPHMVRSFTGADQRWTLAFTLVLSPALLLMADILGRIVMRPGELPAGLVMAVIGAPVFVLLIRRERSIAL
ncbi:FecCD family ABC transporter permease [Rhizobium puerariae]|uniref:FecCD family ABC transporter permease n=1 Tax=Rhizobium puerariae TaxID=1585791 RepID=A0ABV6AI85_9HYPH